MKRWYREYFKDENRGMLLVQYLHTGELEEIPHKALISWFERYHTYFYLRSFIVLCDNL